jgi:copper chaperone CopZ
MKIILTLLISFFSFSTLADEIEVKVNGMVCSLCAQGVEKKFKSHAEVKSIEVNLDNKLVRIETQEGKDLSDEVVKSIIQEAGYHVAKIERK